MARLRTCVLWKEFTATVEKISQRGLYYVKKLGRIGLWVKIPGEGMPHIFLVA